MPLNHTLRLIHTSDWHLGHELFGHGREAEHDAFLAWLVDQLEEEQADALVVAGDVYDVAHPPVAAMARLYRFLREATDRCPHLQIVMIGGNHDSAARINLPAPLLDQGRVHLLGALPRTREEPQFDKLCVPLCNRDGQTAAWAIAVPYCRPGDLCGRSLPELFSEAVGHALGQAEGLPLIACGHLHLAGGETSEHSERRITIGGEDGEASAMFDARLAYVALGHLHRPQQIKGETLIRYSGSPIPLSAAERTYRHSIAVVDVGPGGAGGGRGGARPAGDGSRSATEGGRAGAAGQPAGTAASGNARPADGGAEVPGRRAGPAAGGASRLAGAGGCRGDGAGADQPLAQP